MNLVIAFVVAYSVLVNGQWVPQQQEGTIVQAVVDCHWGLEKYRRELGAREDVRFESFACVEGWYNADGTRYVRP